MMELTDENKKRLALGAGALFAIYIVYKYGGYNHRRIEGFSHKKGGSPDYKGSLQQLTSNIKVLKNNIDVGASRGTIEDILTELTELMNLGKLNTLLHYSNSKKDSASTHKVGENLRAFADIMKALDESMEYLDTMGN